MKRLLAFGILGSSIATAGPISKFDNDNSVRLTSAKSAWDIERCLVDLGGSRAPLIYRQPDRPNNVTIIWTEASGHAVNRVDLTKTAAGTEIVTWKDPKQLSECL